MIIIIHPSTFASLKEAQRSNLNHLVRFFSGIESSTHLTMLVYLDFSVPSYLRPVFSPQIEMLKNNATCTTLCTANVPGEDAKFINDRIKEDYALNWLIDGLPAAEMKKDVKSGETFYDIGFNLGNDEEEYAEKPYLNNHYDIYVQ